MTSVDIQTLSQGLTLAEDGIWYGAAADTLSYPSTGHNNCFAVEENSFWFQHRNNCIAALLRRYPPADHGALFDIGGGNGYVAWGLTQAGFDVVLVEPGLTGARNAKQRGVKQVICATTDTAQFMPQSLPAVGLFDVIEHIEDDLAFLKSIRALIKRGGRLYVTVPSYPCLFSAEDITAGHFRRYTLAGICSVLQTAGFEIEFSSYIFRALPLPVFIMRTLPYKLGLANTHTRQNTLARDHVAQGGGGSRFLNALLQAELKHLAQGHGMSFGSSCLVTARAP